MGIWPSAVESLVTLPDTAFWQGRRVLLTGHTGFKGAWMTLLLKRLGAQVTGISLAPDTTPNLFAELGLQSEIDHHVKDISAGVVPLTKIIDAAQPSIVIHMAAQALVRESYCEPVKTFASNVMGTVNVLEAVRSAPRVEVTLVVTTDKVYRNDESGRPFCEGDPLGGHDPYSASKAACEMVVESYRKSFFQDGCPLVSARAGNVIGGGDWSTDRLIPDAVRAWSDGEALKIRSPHSVRPWQHVLEPLVGYLVAIEKSFEEPALATDYNFGPPRTSAAEVGHVVSKAAEHFGTGAVDFEQVPPELHEAGLLLLDTSKVQKLLGVYSVLSVDEAVQLTMAWYRDFYDQASSARKLCEGDIEFYFNKIGGIEAR